MSDRDDSPPSGPPQLDLFAPRAPRPPAVRPPEPPAPVEEPVAPAAPTAAPINDGALQRAFEVFHAENPKVYETLVHFARIAIAAGHKKIGIGALYERMRWELWIATVEGDGFTLNNNHRSRYARLMMAQEPDLVGVFDTRELRS